MTPVSQRSWVRFLFKPEFFFQVSSFQLLNLKHLHSDDLHIILKNITLRQPNDNHMHTGFASAGNFVAAYRTLSLAVVTAP